MFKNFKVKAAGEVFNVDYDSAIGVAMVRMLGRSASEEQLIIRACDGIEWVNRQDNEHYCTTEEFKEFVNTGLLSALYGEKNDFQSIAKLGQAKMFACRTEKFTHLVIADPTGCGASVTYTGGDGETAGDARKKSVDVIQDAIDRIAKVLEDMRNE